MPTASWLLQRRIILEASHLGTKGKVTASIKMQTDGKKYLWGLKGLT